MGFLEVEHISRGEDFYFGSVPTSFIGDQGTIIQSKDLSYISEGCNASVWRYDSFDEAYAFKLFFEGCSSYALSYDAYQKMKRLSLKRTVKPIEMFRDQKTDTGEFESGYLMPLLVPNEDMTLLDMPTSCLLENVRLLQDDVQLLTEENIQMKDVRYENSIFDQTTGMLYVTDVDMFECADYVPKDKLLEYNYKRLLYLLKDHLQRSVTCSNDFDSSHKKASGLLIKRDFSMDALLECPPAVKIEQAFSKFEHPKQYFLKR